MKLFKATSFFINLLNRTFSDKNFKAFTIMMIILICTFSNVVYIFNKTRGVREKDGEFWKDYKDYDGEGTINDEIFTKDVPSDFLNSFFFSYKLSLGEFDTEGFRGENEMFLWAIFIAATFLLQITFLNMLIAIMANTFYEVLANQQTATMRERIEILSDFRLVVRWLRLDTEF